MFLILQPIQPAKVVLRELSAHWAMYAKIVQPELGQMMPHLYAVLTDNTKDLTHFAKTAHRENI